MKTLLTMTVALAVLATFSGLATAAASVKSSKSNQSERVVDKASPKLFMTGKVTQVNPTANTFIVIANGQMVTFNGANLNAFPKVGEIIDITYTQTPGGPMMATTINTTRSNTF